MDNIDLLSHLNPLDYFNEDIDEVEEYDDYEDVEELDEYGRLYIEDMDATGFDFI